jgi:hypothetical protein
MVASLTQNLHRLLMKLCFICFEQTINLGRYVSNILLAPFTVHYRRRKTHGHFMEDGAKAHTANYAINVLNEA